MSDTDRSTARPEAPPADNEDYTDPVSQADEYSAWILRNRIHHHDLYAALGLAVGAPLPRIEEAILRRREELAAQEQTPETEKATRQLSSIAHVLLDSARRAAYDRERVTYSAYAARARMGRPMERSRENVGQTGGPRR